MTMMNQRKLGVPSANIPDRDSTNICDITRTPTEDDKMHECAVTGLLQFSVEVEHKDLSIFSINRVCQKLNFGIELERTFPGCAKKITETLITNYLRDRHVTDTTCVGCKEEQEGKVNKNVFMMAGRFLGSKCKGCDNMVSLLMECMTRDVRNCNTPLNAEDWYVSRVALKITEYCNLGR